MRQIIDFFVRNKNFILFIFLFSVSLTLLFTSSNFHKSYFLNSTNLISGNIYELNKSINDYF
ncbi:MAG: rod shape-determining protein MreC, partial [Flavobacteriaceae bacterium]|nr:rod shape-determining protein MreC [Flavobacteriaceae bacterium]